MHPLFYAPAVSLSLSRPFSLHRMSSNVRLGRTRPLLLRLTRDSGTARHINAHAGFSMTMMMPDALSCALFSLYGAAWPYSTSAEQQPQLAVFFAAAAAGGGRAFVVSWIVVVALSRLASHLTSPSHHTTISATIAGAFGFFLVVLFLAHSLPSRSHSQ